MSTIASLAVNLSARTAAFESGMGRGRKSLRGFENVAASVETRLASFGRRLLAVAGVGGLLYLGRQVMSSMDEAAKLADVLDLDVQQLVRFRHAAELSGMASENFDKGLSIFVRRLGEVRAGVGEATAAMDALGLSADDLAEMDTAQAFKTVADQIMRIPKQADRAFIAYRLLGRQGISFLKMMEDGSAGIEEMGRRAGATFDRMDAGNVEEANDALADLKRAGRGMAETVMAELAPALTVMANLVTNALQGVRGLDSGVLDQIGSMIRWTISIYAGIKVMGLVTRAIGGLIKAYKALAAGQVTLLSLSGPKGWAVLAASAAIAGGAVIAANRAFDRALASVKQAAEGTEKLAKKNEDAAASYEDLEQAAVPALNSVAQMITDVQQRIRQAGMGKNAVEMSRVLAAAHAEKLQTGDEEAYLARISQILALFEKLERAEGFVEARSSIGSMNAELEKSIATMGMSANAARMWALEQQVAATGSQSLANRLERTRELMQDLERLEGQQQAAEWIARLDRELASLQQNLGPEGLQILDLRALGVAEADLARITARLDQLQKARDAATRASSLKTAGEQLTRQMATPIEAFQNRVAEIQEMLGAGVISQETAARAVQSALGTAASGMAAGPASPGGSAQVIASSRQSFKAVGKQDEAKSMPSLLEKQLGEMAKTNELLRRLIEDGGL